MGCIKRTAKKVDNIMVRYFLYIVLFFAIYACDSPFREPTKEQIANDSKILFPVSFEGKIIEFKNLGPWVRRHQGIILDISYISERNFDDRSSSLFKYDSKANKLFLFITMETSRTIPSLFERYYLRKEKNSDLVKAYNEQGKIVKVFKVFE